jgi:hypothetical protein
VEQDKGSTASTDSPMHCRLHGASKGPQKESLVRGSMGFICFTAIRFSRCLRNRYLDHYISDIHGRVYIAWDSLDGVRNEVQRSVIDQCVRL